jgi:hypothetical protein
LQTESCPLFGWQYLSLGEREITVAFLLPAFFGFVAGLVSGFVLVYLLPSYFHGMTAQLIGGVLIGGFFGAVVGAVSGEMTPDNKAGGSGNRLLVAALFGAIGGFLGATRLGIVWATLRNFNVPTPF